MKTVVQFVSSFDPSILHSYMYDAVPECLPLNPICHNLTGTGHLILSQKFDVVAPPTAHSVPNPVGLVEYCESNAYAAK